ncbi:class F sortase [Micromonospora sp. NBC_00898]|uniref:class F sortase n=1 Tax=Micromonospora sp. NBC_00898 TaxID=2975981 RepID=UPI00386B164C|nr:class F sortase [Micromonospora sp. NBC_00898]
MARGRNVGAGSDPADLRTRRGNDSAAPDRDRRQPRPGRTREPRGRVAARLLSRASRRFARAAGHAFSASVTTADPQARPVPAAATRPGAAGRWQSVGQRGPGAPVLVIATLMVLIVAMLGVERVTGINVLPEQLSAGLRPPPKKFPVLPASPPTDLAIGKIDLRAPVHRVGIAPDGTIAVPDVGRSGEAGWYDQGPTPGQYGPAVIVGHVDTTTGPAVFHDLKSLDDGDRVEVTRADRSVAVFEVTSVQRYGKDRLPADEIFGDFSRPNLRLITCGGRWVGGETGYADNLVVYASLVKARSP